MPQKCEENGENLSRKVAARWKKMWTFANGWRVFPFSTWTRAQTSTLTSPKRRRVRVAKGREASLIDYWPVRWPNYVHKLWNCSLILAVRAKRQFFFLHIDEKKCFSFIRMRLSRTYTHAPRSRRARFLFLFFFFTILRPSLSMSVSV